MTMITVRALLNNANEEEMAIPDVQSGTTGLKLPDSIGKLKHLRYMDLSCWEIHFLPDDVCNLYSLQTLILSYCMELVELPNLLGNLRNLRYLDLFLTGVARLPTTMNRLKNLRHLDIRNTKILEMPPQLGQLTKLVVLTDFFVGKGKSYSIAELGPLEHLGGELCIWNLENVVDPCHASEANLKGKRYIEKLELRWGEDDGCSRSLSEHILEQLQPSSYLKALEVHNYPGVRFPNWLGEHCFSMLTSLHLSGGRHCSELPVLAQLKLLKELKIAYFDSIVSIGPEFYGINSCNKKSFPSLEKLAFLNMPRLQQLMPPPRTSHHLPVMDDDEHCPVLETIESVAGIESTVSLEDSDALEELSKHMHSLLPSLTELTLSFCTKLRSFPGGGLPSSIEILKISDCPGIESSPEGGFPSNLKELEIRSCGKLVAGRKNWGLRALQSLSSLCIDGSEEVLESFPEETFLPPHSILSSCGILHI
ncbi:hypothetical protein Tsubulata_048034, partial [Turnera subulata]